MGAGGRNKNEKRVAFGEYTGAGEFFGEVVREQEVVGEMVGKPVGETGEGEVAVGEGTDAGEGEGD